MHDETLAVQGLRGSYRVFGTWGWFLAAVCGAALPTRAAAPVVLQIHWYPQAQFAGYMVAEERGYFAKAGLPDMKLAWSAAGDRPFDRLAEGRIDFCLGWLADGIVEREAGKPLVNIAQVIQRSSLMLVVRRDSGIVEPKDLSGKRVGLWGGNFDVPAMAFFRQFGAQPVIVPQSNSMVPFLRGAVDAASAMHYNEYHKLIESGLRTADLRMFAFADFGIAFPEDGIYSTEETRRKRPECCAAVVSACREGWQHALAAENESETLDVVMKHCRAANARTNRNHQQWMLRAMRTAIQGGGAKPLAFGSLPPDVYQSVTRSLQADDLIRKPPEYQAFFQPPGRNNGP